MLLFCHHYCWAVSTNHPIRIDSSDRPNLCCRLGGNLSRNAHRNHVDPYLLIAGVDRITGFAGGASGIGVLFGPTGGYLIGFIFNGLLTGKLLETGRAGYVRGMLANIAGALATLFLVPYG